MSSCIDKNVDGSPDSSTGRPQAMPPMPLVYQRGYATLRLPTKYIFRIASVTVSDAVEVGRFGTGDTSVA